MAHQSVGQSRESLEHCDCFQGSTESSHVGTLCQVRATSKVEGCGFEMFSKFEGFVSGLLPEAIIDAWIHPYSMHINSSLRFDPTTRYTNGQPRKFSVAS